jgi:hypothetical protein
MTRLATTSATIGILAVGMLAAGLAAGCGSNQVTIGSQDIDAAAGRGGALAGGSGGSATGGAVGSGGATPSGGNTVVGSGGSVGTGGSKASGGTTASGGAKAGGGTIATGGVTGTGGGTTTTCAGLSESCVTSSCCAPLVCTTLFGSPSCAESYPPPATGGAGPGGGSPNKGGSTAAGGTTGTGGSTGTGGTGGSTGTTCGGLRGMSCATGEFCELPTGSCNVSDATGTCVVKKALGSCPNLFVAQLVCGCDGKTYDSDCERQAAGISKQADGACPTADAGVIMIPTLPAACQVDGDCCVAVDACTAMAYLVGRNEYQAMVASIPSISSGLETCLRCMPPAVQVRCNSGFCAGEKLSISSSALTTSHCGYVNLSDAGTSTGSAHAAVDAGTAASPSTWGCGL